MGGTLTVRFHKQSPLSCPLTSEQALWRMNCSSSGPSVSYPLRKQTRHPESKAETAQKHHGPQPHLLAKWQHGLAPLRHPLSFPHFSPTSQARDPSHPSRDPVSQGGAWGQLRGPCQGLRALACEWGPGAARWGDLGWCWALHPGPVGEAHPSRSLIDQHQLQPGEAPLRVPAQQAGPHQEAHRRVRPATASGVALAPGHGAGGPTRPARTTHLTGLTVLDGGGTWEVA